MCVGLGKAALQRSPERPALIKKLLNNFPHAPRPCQWLNFVVLDLAMIMPSALTDD